MAAKGTKRGRGKGTESGTEPTTSPEAPVPPEGVREDEAAFEGERQAGAESTPPSPEQEAVEAAAEPEPQPRAVGPGATESPGSWRVAHLVIAGLAVVLVSAAVAGAVMYATTVDPGRLDQQAQRLEGLAAQTQSQTSRLDAAEEALSGLQSEVGQVTATVSQLQGSLGELQSTAEANRQSLDRMAQTLEGWRSAGEMAGEGVVSEEVVSEVRNSIATLDERIASLEQGENLQDLTGRMSRLEDEIAALRQETAQRNEQAESATALGRAYAALRERVAAGEPYAQELQALAAELPAAPGLEMLRPHAGEGVATVSTLQARLDEIAADLPSDEVDGTAAGDGFWETMGERIEGMVTVRRADEPDWPATMARTREALQRGNIDDAIAAVEPVSEAGPAELQAWLADARARAEVQAGLDELSDAVVRQFAGRR